jgi:hypothetical protein
VHLKCWDSYPGSSIGTPYGGYNNSRISGADSFYGSSGSATQFGGTGLEPARIKFRRAHNSGICQQTFTFHSGRHILLVQTGSSQEFGWLIDTETNDQYELRLYGSGNPPPQAMGSPASAPVTAAIPPATPLFFDDTRLVIIEPPSILDYPAKHVVKIWNWRTNTLITSFTFEKSHKAYWGFQLSGIDPFIDSLIRDDSLIHCVHSSIHPSIHPFTDSFID